MHILPGYFLRFPFGIISAVLLYLSCPAAARISAEAAGITGRIPDGQRDIRKTALHSPSRVSDTASAMEMLRASDIPLRTGDTATIAFIGDVMLHSRQIADARSRYVSGGGSRAADDPLAYDFTPYLQDIRGALSEADAAVANMEFTLAGPPFTGYPAFSAPDSYAEYVADCGVDIFLTANNHINDKGARGLRRTMDIYRDMHRSHGIWMTGCSDSSAEDGPDILMMRIKGIRTAFLNFTYGTNSQSSHPGIRINTLGKQEVKEALLRARDEGADFIVALPHWGEEYVLSHSEAQEEMARWMAENGADIIIGSHPHVIQDCDTVHVKDGDIEKAVPVVYSLGNIVSNMSARDTQAGLLLEMTLEKDLCGKTRISGLNFRYTWCSLPGMLSDSYRTIFIQEWLDRKDEWMTAWDWTKMKDTYRRIIKETGIKDGNTAAKDEEDH